MPSPIIIDDGGSIRIRQIGAKLDSLLDGSATVNDTFTKVHLSHHANNGANHTHQSGVGSGGFSPLSVGDQIIITTSSGVTLTVTINSRTSLQVALGGGALVDARTESGQRIYRVLNGETIQTVFINAEKIFDNTAGGGTLPSVLTLASIQ